MRASALLLLAAAGAAWADVPEPRPVKSAVEITALYYPGTEHRAEWDMVEQTLPHVKPLLGWYDEGNPEVVDWQIKWAVEHGISSFCVDWYWNRGEQRLDHWVKAFYRAKHRKYLKWYMMYANHNAPGSHSTEDQIALSKWWIDNYFTTPEYYTIDGKPVVVMWDTAKLDADFIAEAARKGERLASGEGVRRAFAITERMARERGLKGVYWIDMYHGWKYVQQKVDFAKGIGCRAQMIYNFDSLAYFMVPESRRPTDTRNKFSYDLVRAAIPKWWEMTSRDPSFPFWPIIPTGWNDQPRSFQRARVIEGRTPEKFLEVCRACRAFCEKKGFTRVVIAPVNEWQEGSYVEPNEEFGFGMYDALREAFCEKPAGGWPKNLTPKDARMGPYDYPPMARSAVQAWTFDRTTEGWYRQPYGCQVTLCKKGALWFLTSRDDNFQIRQRTKPFSASLYRNFRLRMKVSLNPAYGLGRFKEKGARMRLKWGTAQSPIIRKDLSVDCEKAVVSAPVVADGEWHEYTMPLSAHPDWTGDVNELWFEAINAQHAIVEIDWMKFCNDSFPSPTWCVRACPEGEKAARRLWQGIPSLVKNWELEGRAKALAGRSGIAPYRCEGEASCAATPPSASRMNRPVFVVADGIEAPVDLLARRGYALVRWNGQNLSQTLNEVMADSAFDASRVAVAGTGAAGDAIFRESALNERVTLTICPVGTPSEARLLAPRLAYLLGAKEKEAAFSSVCELYRAYRLEERLRLAGAVLDWSDLLDFADRHLKAPSPADSDAIDRLIAAALADGTRTVTLKRNAASTDGTWRLTRAILVPNDFTLVFDGCRVALADGTQDNLVRNAGAAEVGGEPNHGLKILGRNGAVLSGGTRNHYLPKRSGDPNGWRSVGILLCDVSDYEVGGFAMEETQCWAISQERCSRGRVHDLVFGSTDLLYNQDGVDVRKGCHDLVIENISGVTGDDAVALTAYRDPRGAPPRFGMQIGGNAWREEKDDVYNVTIRNVRARSAGGHGVIRLLVCDGICMHHITVENVIDTATGREKRPQATLRIGDVAYHKTRRCAMGEMHHIAVRHVEASGKVAVWLKGPLCDSSIVDIHEGAGGRKYDITAPLERVTLDESVPAVTKGR